MISPEKFYQSLARAGVNFVCGVPDSLLKEFCAYAAADLPGDRHLITANEGTAVAVAAGMQMATGGVPLVYLQNSGLGNTINPLLSLVDPAVYGIPLVLLIGWRGEPGVKDEPQHVKQGLVSPAMLTAMDVPFGILDGDPDQAAILAVHSVEAARARGGPFVLLARKNAFGPAEKTLAPVRDHEGLLGREQAIALIVGALPADATLVATTGHISRELYEIRVRAGQNRASDFLTVGCMGHASQIALGLALGKKNARVVCLDGDGAALMHMGGLATIGTSGADNLLHIVLNNGVHDSVGAQPTVALQISLTAVAQACRYPGVWGPCISPGEIREALSAALAAAAPAFLEIRVKPGARADLGRPKESPAENKRIFIERLAGL